MTFLEFPLWIQASFVAFYLGIFLMAMALTMWLLEHIPPLYDLLDRVLGGGDDDQVV